MTRKVKWTPRQTLENGAIIAIVLGAAPALAGLFSARSDLLILAGWWEIAAWVAFGAARLWRRFEVRRG